MCDHVFQYTNNLILYLIWVMSKSRVDQVSLIYDLVALPYHTFECDKYWQCVIKKLYHTLQHFCITRTDFTRAKCLDLIVLWNQFYAYPVEPLCANQFG